MSHTPPPALSPIGPPQGGENEELRADVANLSALMGHSGEVITHRDFYLCIAKCISSCGGHSLLWTQYSPGSWNTSLRSLSWDPQQLHRLEALHRSRYHSLFCLGKAGQDNTSPEWRRSLHWLRESADAFSFAIHNVDATEGLFIDTHQGGLRQFGGLWPSSLATEAYSPSAEEEWEIFNTKRAWYQVPSTIYVGLPFGESVALQSRYDHLLVGIQSGSSRSSKRVIVFPRTEEVIHGEYLLEGSRVQLHIPSPSRRLEGYFYECDHRSRAVLLYFLHQYCYHAMTYSLPSEYVRVPYGAFANSVVVPFSDITNTME